jgi:pimeloyl-ACP methyl ester carboxylesterase
MVLINTSLGGHSPFWQRLRPGAWPDLLRAAVADAPRRERIILARTSTARGADDTLAAQWAAWALERPVSRVNALRQLAAAARYREGARPAVPVLLLASAGDRLVSVRCSQRLAQAWGCPLRLHATAGHDLPLDAPGWVVDQVTAFRPRSG